MRETRSQVEIREEKIRDLKLEVETERESNAKHMTLAQSLRQQLIRFEAEAGSLEGAASRSELAVHTLQTQNNDLQNRILELESRLRYEHRITIELVLYDSIYNIHFILLQESLLLYLELFR